MTYIGLTKPSYQLASKSIASSGEDGQDAVYIVDYVKQPKVFKR